MSLWRAAENVKVMLVTFFKNIVSDQKKDGFCLVMGVAQIHYLNDFEKVQYGLNCILQRNMHQHSGN